MENWRAFSCIHSASETNGRLKKPLNSRSVRDLNGAGSQLKCLENEQELYEQSTRPRHLWL